MTGSVLGDGQLPAMGRSDRRNGPQGQARAAALVLDSEPRPERHAGRPARLLRPPYPVDGAACPLRIHGDRTSGTAPTTPMPASSTTLSGTIATWSSASRRATPARTHPDRTHRSRGRSAAPSTAKNCLTAGADRDNRPRFDIHYDIRLPYRPVRIRPGGRQSRGHGGLQWPGDHDRSPYQARRRRAGYGDPLGPLAGVAHASTDWCLKRPRVLL